MNVIIWEGGSKATSNILKSGALNQLPIILLLMSPVRCWVKIIQVWVVRGFIQSYLFWALRDVLGVRILPLFPSFCCPTFPVSCDHITRSLRKSSLSLFIWSHIWATALSTTCIDHSSCWLDSGVLSTILSPLSNRSHCGLFEFLESILLLLLQLLEWQLVMMLVLICSLNLNRILIVLIFIVVVVSLHWVIIILLLFLVLVFQLLIGVIVKFMLFVESLMARLLKLIGNIGEDTWILMSFFGLIHFFFIHFQIYFQIQRFHKWH